MTADKEKPPAPPRPADIRKARLAAALRANLRRRKAAPAGRKPKA